MGGSSGSVALSGCALDAPAGSSDTIKKRDKPVPPSITSDSNPSQNDPNGTITEEIQINEAKNAQNCSDCKIECVFHKDCFYCKKNLCFECSGLPKLIFIYYFKTKAHFRCEDCCLTDMKEKRNILVEDEIIKLEDEISLLEVAKKPQFSQMIEKKPQFPSLGNRFKPPLRSISRPTQVMTKKAK